VAGGLTAAQFRRHVAVGADAADEVEPRLRRAYSSVLRELGLDAATRFERYAQSLVASADDPQPKPSFSQPDADEVYPLDSAVHAISQRSYQPRSDAVGAQAAPPLDAAGIAWNLSDPLLAGVLEQMGMKITSIAEEQRREIMEIIQEGYDAGDSIQETARKLRANVRAMSAIRSERIVRTEMISAKNGAQHAAAIMTGAVPYKQWLATVDGRTRPSHAAVSGQTVPTGEAQSFDVGGYRLLYPGDPAGPAEEVINCRCVLLYTDRPEGEDGVPTQEDITGDPALWEAGRSAATAVQPSDGLKRRDLAGDSARVSVILRSRGHV
jgi:uncharacterized membrane protein